MHYICICLPMKMATVWWWKWFEFELKKASDLYKKKNDKRAVHMG